MPPQAIPGLKGVMPPDPGLAPAPTDTSEPVERIAALVPQAPAGWIDLTITDLPDELVRDGGARAWVLPAGAPGTDDWRQVIQATPSDAGASIALPRVGRYDVGVRVGRLVHIEEDVEVVPGQRTAVSIAYPSLGPIRFVFDEPPDDSFSAWLDVAPSDTTGAYHHFPVATTTWKRRSGRPGLPSRNARVSRTSYTDGRTDSSRAMR